MVIGDLEAKIEKSEADGCLPFLVVATCGTTVLGAFDPLHLVADVCEKHGVWFHVDVSSWLGLDMSTSFNPQRC